VELAVVKHRVLHMQATYQSELERHASTDPLTGLLNRRRLADELSVAALRAANAGDPYTIVMIDIDNFKQINDTLGHTTGDAVLVEFARILRKSFRSDDILARYGGDEFVAVLPETTSECRSRVVARLQGALAESQLAQRLGLTLSASVGVADSSAGSSEEVLKSADRAMYESKRRSAAIPT
jgi:diguanylate cyclase (GGDEF)-like protein